MQLSNTFLCYFESLPDPRTANHNKRHNLEDILVITILAIICGADNWVEISQFANSKKEWLSTFLKLPNGIPSHDTFGRVFSLLDPVEFEKCFKDWIKSLDIDVKGQVIAVDGKTLRGSGNRRRKQKPLHLVSAWACEKSLFLGQVKTREKSNEITAIPKLLKMIDIKGSTITIDAMGCQESIAKEILRGGANYVLSLKDNQPKLHEFAKAIFEMGTHRQFKKILHRRVVEKVHDHGRIETRKYTLISAKDKLPLHLRWSGLNGIGELEVKRTTNHQVEVSKRYFLTNFTYEQIDLFRQAARKHWNIEIGLHWSIDVSFSEDHNQARKKHSARNLSTIRRIALNLLKHENTIKAGIKCKRKTAGWNHDYLLKVLSVDLKAL